MDYSNGYIFPKEYTREAAGGQPVSGAQAEDDERMARALTASAAQNQASAESAREEEDGAVLAVAMEVAASAILLKASLPLSTTCWHGMASRAHVWELHLKACSRGAAQGIPLLVAGVASAGRI